ncbi:ETC complex I subunit [Ahrensia sp. AH-315-G08]|nr:ETC complex I subunit [Ahrensia sp. AH-315-G08]
MVAKIYRPAKSAMQSGKGKTHLWILEFEREQAKTTEPFMGYTSCSDTLSQVQLKFSSREDAIAYAERNDLVFRVSEPKETTRRAVTYAENFNYDRKVPWTH